jgi:HD superfamily phosphodiesterase
MKIQNLTDTYLNIPRNKRLYLKVKSVFEKRGPIAHNWDHIYRDIVNAIWIGEAEKADMNIVIPAIILHDCGFLYNPDPAKHHLLGAEHCEEWLADEWDNKEKLIISECIKKHKGKILEFNIEPETLEEKVVHDADMLEKVGAIGILQGMRTFVEFAETSHSEYKSLYAIACKLCSVKKLHFYTKTGEELAKKRGGNFRKEIFEQAVKELMEYK